MSIKAQDLFQAYQANQLPSEGGYIVTSFFSENSTYSRYEIISYSGVKSIFLGESDLTFQSDGKKLYILVEPPTYPNKHVEPIHRGANESIPHHYKELLQFICKNDAKLYVSMDPIMTYTSFTILRPSGDNFAFIFYPSADVFDSIDAFFQKTLNLESGVPQVNAKAAAKTISANLHKLALIF